MEEERETRLRRLRYQSSYTGMKETDLLLGAFAKTHLAGLSDSELSEYEALLDAGDGQIYQWASGNEPVPELYLRPLTGIGFLCPVHAGEVVCNLQGAFGTAAACWPGAAVC